MAPITACIAKPSCPEPHTQPTESCDPSPLKHALFSLGRLCLTLLIYKKKRKKGEGGGKIITAHWCQVNETTWLLLADTSVPVFCHTCFLISFPFIERLWRTPGTTDRMRQNLRSQDLGSFKITLKCGHIPKNPSLIYFIMSSVLPKPIYKLLHLMHAEYLANILFLEDSFAWQFCRLYSNSLLIKLKTW